MNNIKIKLVLLSIISLTVFQTSFGQSCRGFESKCGSAPKYFTSSSLSRAIAMRKARKVIVNQTFYGDREYFVSVCGKSKLGKIHFRLITEDGNETVLYDNAIENFRESQLFVIQNTMNVKIELSAPHYFDDENSECAAILISYNKHE
jgi:hypothetical protein